MIRPSKLSIARYCGHASKLADLFREASVFAADGHDWHERMASQVSGKIDDPRLAAVLATMPSHVKMEAEVKVQLKDPETGDLITEGTADLVLTHQDGSLTVPDWKTGNPDRVDPPDENLQIQAYGLGLALSRGAPAFRVGLYFTQYPPLRLSRWYADGQDYWDILANVRRAASADPEVAVTGPHCDQCYQRRHCHAWLLPALTPMDPALQPFAANSGGLTADNAARALRAVQAMKNVVDVAEGQLRTFARANGGIEEDGKTWGPVLANGRRSVSIEAAEVAGLLPQLRAAGAVNDGAPYERFSWRNAGPKRKTAKKASPSEYLAPVAADKESA